MDFKTILFDWYRSNGRDLPWRRTSDPYMIWIAEIILQQTRVAQGIAYYQRFISEFPSVSALASAHEDRVLKVWQGLGYYTRARNLQKGAIRIVNEHGGIIPQTYQELLTIEGIGPYSAGAIASFAFKKVVPAIDGNVYRVMARVFGVFASPFTSKGKTDFYKLVLELIDKVQPNVFNQALLDFGALQCTPKGPRCSSCPFADYCYAYRNNVVSSLPVKAKKNVPRDRFFTYLLIKRRDYTFISKRKAKDIWHSLYEFPLIETITKLNDDLLLQHPAWLRWFKGINATIISISPVVKHQLSHQTLYVTFVIVEVNRISKALKHDFILVGTNDIGNYSTPTLIDNYLAAEPSAKYFLRGSD